MASTAGSDIAVEEVVLAELDIPEPHADPLTESAAQTGKQSWPFRVAGFCRRLASRIFGMASYIFLLAVLANVPLFQLITFGYLLDAGGKAARGEKFRDLFSGLEKASHLGGIFLGTWLLIWPIRIATGFWLDASIIDPSSSATGALKVLQWVLLVGTLGHVFAAIACGGKLRYFFWPLIAPFSIGIWLVRRSTITRKLLSITLGWVSPKMVSDICNAQPIMDWFLPAIFLKRLFRGNLYSSSRDAVWDFIVDLNLPRFFMLGLKGFIGTMIWLALPTLLLAGSTSDKPVVGGFCLFFGIVISVPVFALLPFLQAHFGTDGKLKRFAEPLVVMRQFSRAPFAHLFGLLMTLLLAIPLFLLKIEEVPTEFLWTLSLLFVAFGWPSRIIAGWAIGRSKKKERPVRWWIRYPVQFFAAPISFSFAVIFFLTRYISWNGTLSLLENHVFLLPAPFWLG